ncbi:MAG: phenylalanine--tRNA ligase subunit beta [Acidobacteriota bacterium]|nr:phenylalanine--tRNA ligase subunit beta [Acidobacteriota bacterium]
MKFSYNWIKECVPGLTQAALPLERLITMKTAECEGIEETGALLSGARVANVLSASPLPGTHNVKAVVDLGELGLRVVLCGAPNCRAGMRSVWLPVGRKMIHGVDSDGMLASGDELGISRDHSGIVELTGGDAGALIPGLVPDSIIEIDNKSLTHRPDLWGHHGMAREVAAILGLKLTDPVKLDLLPAGDAAIGVRIEDLTLCPRYSALVFENVKVEPSPLWLQYRLTAIGLNPINNIVDMTNYIMSELAQPMHAFDADLLAGGAIIVRPARAGEGFRALNGEEYRLEPSNLVIADEKGAIALGGVIGGFDSAISGRTTRVVLESASFLASSIRKTSAAVKLRTDASMRFEKAQDPANTVRALARAIELLREICPGARLVGGVADRKREIPPPPPIDLPLPWLAKKLGRELPADDVRRILESLAFGVGEPSPGGFRVTVPSWRATKDISLPDDLVEEVGRMIGYDTITPTAPLLPAVVPPGNPTRRFHHRVRDIVIDQGFTEAYNYSFLSEPAALAFGFAPESHIRVTNAIASDQTLMRRSLLPGIWQNVLENAKHRESFRLFETGMEVHPRAEGLPDEIPHLVAALYERHGDGAAGLYELKRVAGCLMPGAQAVPAAALGYEHPARAAAIEWKGRTVARLLELHPRLVETGRAAVLDVDLRLLEELSAGDTKYTPIRRYPSSAFDLSVIAPLREHAGRLRELIANSAGPLLESVEFQRQYSGPPLAEGTKSVSFRVTIGAPDHTLSNDEIAAARNGVIERMQALDFELRV